MRTYAYIISSNFTASVSIESIGAEARVLENAVTASAQIRPSVKAMAAVLLGLTLVVASPQPQISVRGCVVEEVGTMPYPWITNFITAEGQFLMTADGKIFFCRED